MRSYENYFRQNRLPHLWCPGCGNGIVMKAIVQAIEKKGWTQDNTVIVSGIGVPVQAVIWILTLCTRHTDAQFLLLPA